MEEERRYLTPDELSTFIKQVTGVRKSVKTLRQWRRREEREGVRTGPPWKTIGGSVLYERADVEAWLRERKSSGDGRRGQS